MLICKKAKENFCLILFIQLLNRPVIGDTYSLMMVLYYFNNVTSTGKSKKQFYSLKTAGNSGCCHFTSSLTVEAL